MFCRIVPAVVALICLSSAAQALDIFDNTPLDNTPFDPDTYDPSDWVKPPKESGSSLQFVTSPFIDANGNIWSGTGSGGGKGKYVGKAKIKHIGSRAYWYSNYSNIYGRPQDRRAPKYDKLVFENTVTKAKTQINPNNGQVRRYVYRNGKLQSNSLVGWAQLRYENGNWGRAYYAYGSQTVWANQPAMPQPFGGNAGGGNPNFPNQQMNSPEANIAQGILQIIGGALQGNQ